MEVEGLSDEIQALITRLEDEYKEALGCPFFIALDLERAIIEIDKYPIVIDFPVTVIEAPGRIRVCSYDNIDDIQEKTLKRIQEIKEDGRLREKNLKEAASIMITKLEGGGMKELANELREKAGIR
ncbi:MAG: hypothetical protein RBT32_08030 [Methanothermobacter sp.]|mgnify:CR=1 FL=1|jgi:hypothetical protein|nr:hypothetical protein [Methanothermobacter sp.]